MLKTGQILSIGRQRLQRMVINSHINRFASQVSFHTHLKAGEKPVVFFNASTRLVGVSLNASYALLTALALRLQQVPVVQFVCHAGMSRCVLGTDREDFSKAPPCRACMSQSRWLYSSSMVVPFTYQPESPLVDELRSLSIDRLVEYEYRPAIISVPGGSQSEVALPLGRLVLPSIRWVLRRHTLLDDELTRSLYRKYILSAYCVALEFKKLLERIDPQAVVVFNGQFFPEATVRWVALQHGIRCITHEVGLQPYSAFFTTGEATAYPLDVPDDFVLSDVQNERLDAYLSQRFHGQFSMAGIRFWPEMKGLDQAFLQKAANFKQVVPIFTNVIFDTSQPHSNVVFPHMFAWLDLVLEITRAHPETLFIIRAHPDEARPGKSSQESVAQWFAQTDTGSLPNLVFVDSGQPLSSYELIHRSKFIMVYNSTIGLEASILGAPVLCAGRARFTQLPTVFFPVSPAEYRQVADEFLAADEVYVPPEFQHNARRFLYYQLFRSSLPFGEYIRDDGIWPGFVRLRNFKMDQLSPQRSVTMRILLDGILHGKPFLLSNEDDNSLSPGSYQQEKKIT